MEVEKTKTKQTRQKSRAKKISEKEASPRELEVLIEAPENGNEEVDKDDEKADRSESEAEDNQNDEDDEEISIYSYDSDNVDPNHCEVCYSTVSKRYMQNELKHLFDLIRCKNCDKRAHHICYGMNTPVEQETDENDKVVKYFLCDSCKEGKYGEDVNCYVCGVKEGCLRLTRDRKWIHTLCGAASTQVSFQDVTTMNVDLSSFRKRGQKISASKKCSICKTKIQTFDCINKNIAKSCHLNCALRFGMLRPEKNKWKIFFELQPNQNLLVQEHLEENTVIANIEDLALNLKEVIEATGMSKSSAFPRELKAKKTDKPAKERRKRREGSEVSKFIKDIFEKAKKKVESNFEDDFLEISSTKKNDEAKPDTVGGKVIIVNTLDMTAEEEELIKNDEDEGEEETFMEVEGGSALLDSDSQLILAFYHEIASLNSVLEVYSEEKVAKLRGDLHHFPALSKMTFPEILFFVNVYQKRAQAALNSLCTLEDLEKLIRSASVLPFSMVGILRPLNEKYYTMVSTDVLLRSNVEQCAPQSAYIPDKKNFDEATMKRNQKTVDQALKLQTIYINEPCRGITPQSEELRDNYKQLVFLSELYSEIADYFSSDVKTTRTKPSKASSRSGTPSKGLVVASDKLPNIPLSKLLSLYSQATKLHLSEQFGEIALLKESVGGSKDLLGFDTLRPSNLLDAPSDFSRSGTPSPRRSPKHSPSKMAEGKRNAGNFVEVIPAAPVLLSSSQKGRPKKANKVANEIQKDYKIQIKRIKELPSLEEAEEALEAAQKAGSNKKVEMIEASLKKVSEWKKDFEEAVKKNEGTLGTLIERIELVGVYVPEMATALEYRKEWSLWRNALVNIQRRLKKKVENFFGDISDMVSFEELEQVVKDGKKMIRLEPDDAIYKELKEKYKTVLKVREELNEKNEHPDINQLKEFKKELKNFNVKIPELKKLRKMLAINENIKKMIDEPIGLKKLEQKSHGLQYVPKKVDEKLWEQLKTKIEEGKRMQEQAQKILKQKTAYRVESIAQMAKLLKDAGRYNIEIDEVEKIRKIVDEFLKLAKVYAVVVGAEAVDLEKLESEDYQDLAGKSLDDLVKMSQKALEKNGENFDENKTKELEDVFNGFSYENIENAKVRKFFEKAFVILWKVKAKAFLSNDFKRTSQDIRKFLSDIPQFDQLSNDYIKLFREIGRAEKKVIKWKEDYQKFMDNNSKQTLLELADKVDKQDMDEEKMTEKFEKIKKQIKHLKSDFEGELNMYTDLEENTKSLNKVIRWMDWISDALELKKQIEEEKEPMSYNTVKAIYDRADKLALPKGKGLCKTVVKWYEQAQNLQKEFVEEYENMKVELKKGNLEGSTTRKMLNKNKEKMTLDQAELMLEKLEKGSQVILLPDQVSQVKEDIKVFEQWKEKVKSVHDKYKDALEREEATGKSAEQEADLKRDLAKLKADMLDLPIRDEKTEREIVGLDWTDEAYSLIRNPTRDGVYDEWKKHLKALDKLDTEGKEHMVKLADILTEEIEKADKLKVFVKTLKKAAASKKEKKVSYEELSRVVDDLENAKILMKDEKKSVEHFYDLAKRLKEKARKILEPEEGEKALEEEFVRLKESLERHPVDLSAEVKEIEEVMDQARKLVKDVKRKRPNDAKWSEQIARRYKECPILVEKAARIAKPFEGTQLSPAPEGSETMEEEDAGDVSAVEEEEETIEKSGEKIRKPRKTKAEIFMEKYDNLDRKMFGSALGPRVLMPISDLKKLIREGTRAQKLVAEDEKIGQAVSLLEELLKKAQSKVEEIKAVKNVRDLESLQTTFLNVIDLSSDIAARKDNITLVKVPKSAKKKSEGKDKDKDEVKEKAKKKSEGKDKNKDTDEIKEKSAKKKSEGKDKDKDKDEAKEKVKKKRARSQSEEKRRRSRERSREKERKKPGSAVKEEKPRKEKKKSPEKSDESPKRRKDSKERPTIKKSVGHKSAEKSKESKGRLKDEAEDKVDAYFNDLAKIKTSLKSKQLIVSDLKNILDYSKYLELKLTDTFKYAEVILNALPEMYESNDSYERLIKRMRTLFNSPYLAKSIVEMNFDQVYIRHLAKKEFSDLKTIEQRLREETKKDLVRKDAKVGISRKDTEEGEPVDQFLYDKPIAKKHHPGKWQAGSSADEQGYLSASSVERGPKDTLLTKSQLQKMIKDQKELSENRRLPDNYMLKLFSGTLSWDYERVTPRMVLYTCEDYSTVERMPSLETQGRLNELKISKKMFWPNFEKYFTDVLSSWRLNAKNIKLMSGWAEAEASIYGSRSEQIANELLRDSQVAISEYNEGAKIVFLNKQQMKKNWASMLNLRVKKSRQNSTSVLYFVIIYKPYKLRSETKFIKPETIKAFADHTLGKESLAKGDELDDLEEPGSPKSSERSSLNDYETDYGALVDDMVPKGGKRSFEEAIENDRRDDEHLEMEEIVKKIKSNVQEEKDEVVEKLSNMDQERIEQIARNLDQPEREAMMRAIFEADRKEAEKSLSKEPEFMIPESRENINNRAAKFTPQPPTGSTKASLNKQLQSNEISTVKNTPSEKDRHIEENEQAFANLGPAEIVETTTITIVSEGQAGDEDSITVPTEWGNLIEGLSEGIAVSGQLITLPKDLYQKAKELQKQLLEGIIEEGAKREGQKEGSMEEDQGEQEEMVLVKGRREEDEEPKEPTQEKINEEVEIEEELFIGGAKPTEEYKEGEGEGKVSEGGLEGGMEVEDQSSEQIASSKEESSQVTGEQGEETRPKAMYIESHARIVKQVRYVNLPGEENQQGNEKEQVEEEVVPQEVQIQETITTVINVQAPVEDNQDDEESSFNSD